MRCRVAVGLTIFAVAGCGGGSAPSQRQQVNDYVDNVNALQQAAGPQFQRANRAYLAFSKGKLTTKAAGRELADAERSMRQVRDQIARTNAPSPARELKRRLVALFDADAAMAHEATLLATFVPAAQRAGQPLPRLGRALARSLRSSTTAAQQQSALAAYAKGIGHVLDHLEPLHPPPLLIERQHQQVTHLQTVRGLALRLVGALKAQNSARVARLLLRFQRLSSGGPAGSVSAAAVRSYNQRYRAVTHAIAYVQSERARLERTLK